jgi:hypothetical protein
MSFVCRLSRSFLFSNDVGGDGPQKAHQFSSHCHRDFVGRFPSKRQMEESLVESTHRFIRMSNDFSRLSLSSSFQTLADARTVTVVLGRFHQQST